QVTEERVTAVLAVVARVAVTGRGGAHADSTALLLHGLVGNLDGQAGDLRVPVLDLGKGLDLLGELAGLVALLLHGTQLVGGEVALLLGGAGLDTLDRGAQRLVLLALGLQVRVHGETPVQGYGLGGPRPRNRGAVYLCRPGVSTSVSG